MSSFRTANLMCDGCEEVLKGIVESVDLLREIAAHSFGWKRVREPNGSCDYCPECMAHLEARQ